MSATWETQKLGDVCSFLNRGVSPKYVENGGIIVLNQRCVRDHRIVFDAARRHDVAAKAVHPDRLLQAGDVLVNSTGVGTLGRVAQLRSTPSEPTTVDSHVTIVRPTPEVFYQAFFGYMLRDIEDQLKESGEGCGGQTELGRTVLAEKFSVRFPKSISEQRQIVTILDEAFEGIANAKANAEKNLQNARAIFESRLQFVFTERGKTWKQKTLEEIATAFGRGKSKHRPRNAPHLYGGKYPFVQTGDIRNADHIITEYSQCYSEAGLAQSKLWPKGTICITIAANIAETAILGFDACFPDSVIGIVANPKEADVGFIEYLLQSVKIRIQAMGKGSAQANINMGTFENERFPFPSVNEQQRIVAELDALNAETLLLVSIYERKRDALDDLRRSLLHNAFRGELTPGGSNKRVDAAA
jgi:type I restriction enzyme, S subunit